MYEYFKRASKDDTYDTDETEIIQNIDVSDNNPILNSPITREEIQKCIKLLNKW